MTNTPSDPRFSEVPDPEANMPGGPADPTFGPDAGRGETIGADSTQAQENSGLQRDPDEWATGDEPMTEAQKSYLDTLAKEAGEQLPASLTKAEASKHIDRLQKGSDRLG